MNIKFLDKVYDQIISETRVIDNKLYTPTHSPYPHLFSFFLFTSPHPSFISHCKEIYSLNKEETEYVWVKYKEEVTTLIDKKELV